MEVIIFYVIIGFFISLLLGKLLIPVLHKYKLGQYIREDGPKSHKKKAGTPTFGGLIFIFTTIITMLFILKEYNIEVKLSLYALIVFGFIGLLDDGLKILHKNNEGLTSLQKLLLLIAASCFFALYCYLNPYLGKEIIIPFKKSLWNMKLLYIPFIVFYYVSATNAVNLTDGLDGLVGSISLLVMTFFTLIAFSLGHYSLSIFCSVMVGALLGFLKFNHYPAKIIMGDTGALALGGAMATITIMLKLPLIFIIVGGVFVTEILSVAIQITSFKLTGKRVFKMAPLHHSFELCGWHEVKIVALFSIITVILCLIGFISLAGI